MNLLKKETFTQQKCLEEDADKKKRVHSQKESERLSDELLSKEHHVSINFESFHRVFPERPCFFYDMLFVLAGIRYNSVDYPPQEYPKFQPVEAVNQQKQEPPVQRYGRLLDRMRQTCS